MAWHENLSPAIKRAEKRKARQKFKAALLLTELSDEEKEMLIKLYDKGR